MLWSERAPLIRDAGQKRFRRLACEAGGGSL